MKTIIYLRLIPQRQRWKCKTISGVLNKINTGVRGNVAIYQAVCERYENTSWMKAHIQEEFVERTVHLLHWMHTTCIYLRIYYFMYTIYGLKRNKIKTVSGIFLLLKLLLNFENVVNNIKHKFLHIKIFLHLQNIDNSSNK